MIRTVARRSAPTRPALLTPAFVAVTLASLAYFTGDGVLIPAVPRYVQAHRHSTRHTRMMQRKPRWEVPVSIGWAMRAAGR